MVKAHDQGDRFGDHTMKYAVLLFTILLVGCSSTSIIIPIDRPVIIKGEMGERDKECQTVIIDGKPVTECVERFASGS